MTHTIYALTAAATAAIDAMQADKFGRKEASAEAIPADGSVAACTVCNEESGPALASAVPSMFTP